MRIFLLFIFLLQLNWSFGQFKNVILDTQDSSGYACEPSVAINPKDPQNIVVASVLNNVYVTIDGGLKWTKRKVQSPMGVYGDPALIADASGRFYFFHLSDPTHGKGGYDSDKLDRIVVQSSADKGVMWSDGESIGLNSPKDQDKAWPYLDAKGNLSLAWTQFDQYGSKDPNCQSYIMMSTSRNGIKWSDPIEMSQTPGDCSDGDNTVMGGMPVVTLDGKSFVIWAHQQKIFMDRSFDGKMWLSNDLAIAEQIGGWDQSIPGHDRCNGLPTVATDRAKNSIYKGSLYVTWSDQRNGENDTDIWFIRSVNFGDNWTPPVRINNDGPGRHQYLPWMTTDLVTGTIYVLYYDRRNYDDLNTDVYLAYSKDGGRSFVNVKVSETPFVPSPDNFFGDYTNITAYKGIIAAVWTRMDNGKNSVVCSIIRQDDLDVLK